MKSILWVEDETRHYYVFSYQLKDIFSITLAKTYKEGLDKSKLKYDLIVIDIILPSGMPLTSEDEIDEISNVYYGLELIKNIREHDKNTPIFVLTVVNRPDVWEEIKEIDENIVIKFKYDTDPEEVKNIITKILERE